MRRRGRSCHLQIPNQAYSERMRRSVSVCFVGAVLALAPRVAADTVAKAPPGRADAPATGTPTDPIEGPRHHVSDTDVVLSRRGLAMALRVGWGIPQGQLRSGNDLADSTVGMLPIWLDLGYRFTDHLLVGIFAQYAFSLVRHCSFSPDCNASDVRFGFQAQWHFGARDTIDHWVGVGTGFEIYDEDAAGIASRYGGYEFVNFQFGEDLSLGRRFGLGPFLAVSIGKFVSLQRGPSDGPLQDFDIAKRALHVWTIFGLRLSYGA
jgi:hypothetical protein